MKWTLLCASSAALFLILADCPHLRAESETAKPSEGKYIVQKDDTLAKIAYKFYGDPVLWWVLAVANQLEILPTDLKFGSTLRVPSKTYVYGELLGRQLPVF